MNPPGRSKPVTGFSGFVLWDPANPTKFPSTPFGPMNPAAGSLQDDCKQDWAAAAPGNVSNKAAAVAHQRTTYFTGAEALSVAQPMGHDPNYIVGKTNSGSVRQFFPTAKDQPPDVPAKQRKEKNVSIKFDGQRSQPPTSSSSSRPLPPSNAAASSSLSAFPSAQDPSAQMLPQDFDVLDVTAETVALDLADMHPLVHCPLCLQQMVEPTSLPCLHTFCYSCLSQAMGSYCECPARCGFTWEAWDPPVPSNNPFVSSLLESLSCNKAVLNPKATSFYPTLYHSTIFGKKVQHFGAPDLPTGTQEQLLVTCRAYGRPSTLESLTAGTYGNFYRTLLEMEKQVVDSESEKECCFYNCQLFKYAPAEGNSDLPVWMNEDPQPYIRMPLAGLWEEKPMVQYGDKVHIRSLAGGTKYEAVVADLKKSPVFLERMRWGAPCLILTISSQFWAAFPTSKTINFTFGSTAATMKRGFGGCKVPLTLS